MICPWNLNHRSQTCWSRTRWSQTRRSWNRRSRTPVSPLLPTTAHHHCFYPHFRNSKGWSVAVEGALSFRIFNQVGLFCWDSILIFCFVQWGRLFPPNKWLEWIDFVLEYFALFPHFFSNVFHLSLEVSELLFVVAYGLGFLDLPRSTSVDNLISDNWRLIRCCCSQGRSLM